ncbi:MAG: hypothetical protein M0P31_13815 [Solirubrobacteraceae bacterium]|nr:hypothetical protein [Solirubrobacteraceae bacterium]
MGWLDRTAKQLERAAKRKAKAAVSPSKPPARKRPSPDPESITRADWSGPDIKAVYWSSIGCCPACDALDDGYWYLPHDPTFPDVAPPADCTNPTGCTCSPIGIYKTEQPLGEPEPWSEWSAARLAEQPAQENDDEPR